MRSSCPSSPSALFPPPRTVGVARKGPTTKTKQTADKKKWPRQNGPTKKKVAPTKWPDKKKHRPDKKKRSSRHNDEKSAPTKLFLASAAGRMHCKFTATVLAPSILSGILSGTLSGSLAGHFVEAVRCRPALAPPSLRDEHPQGASSCRGAGRKGEGRGGGGGGAGAGFDHSRGISQGEDDTPIPTPMPLPCRCLVRLPGGGALFGHG